MRHLLVNAILHTPCFQHVLGVLYGSQTLILVSFQNYRPVLKTSFISTFKIPFPKNLKNFNKQTGGQQSRFKFLMLSAHVRQALDARSYFSKLNIDFDMIEGP